VFPTLEEQTSARLLSGDTVKAISDTSAFLKEQKKAERVLVDYKPFVNPQFAKQAKQ
jgi:taurine transport system substrate-binding protein